jgi:hypothetical protein
VTVDAREIRKQVPGAARSCLSEAGELSRAIAFTAELGACTVACVPWSIRDNLGQHARAGYDARGWLWEIARGDDVQRVLVEVSRTALAVADATLPGDVAAAIRTQGQSEVVKVLTLDAPPRVIQCGTNGCHAAPAEDTS